MLSVHHYYRFKLNLDDICELISIRRINLSHQTIHNWSQIFGVELGLKLRESRKGIAGRKWHVDATCLKIEGRWYYLYRAIDKEGDFIDVYLSDVRDQKETEKFFKQAHKTAGLTPEQITTGKEKALHPAIKNVFGNKTKHRDCKYNCLKQDHRGIQSRYKVIKGSKSIFCALILYTSFEETKQFFRMTNKTRGEKRGLFVSRFQQFNNLAIANS